MDKEKEIHMILGPCAFEKLDLTILRNSLKDSSLSAQEVLQVERYCMTISLIDKIKCMSIIEEVLNRCYEKTTRFALRVSVGRYPISGENVIDNPVLKMDFSSEMIKILYEQEDTFLAAVVVGDILEAYRAHEKYLEMYQAHYADERPIGEQEYLNMLNIQMRNAVKMGGLH